MRGRTVRGGITLAAAALVTIGCGGDASAEIPVQVPAGAPEAVSVRSAVAVKKDVADPVRLSIPAIGVSTKVIALPLDRKGRLVAPRQFDRVGWNKAGPEPGEKGVAVIAGHVDSKTGPAVFYRLRHLSKGDRVHVHRKDGTTATFTVHRIARYPKNRIPDKVVYSAESGAHLRLITCGGTFDRSRGSYRDNIVVFAR
ncbi:class F sortase [Acrocarpospora phusangensis]|uniref:Class F sortase n=1 Tax=Acrocarpospora phusangensis TaxID=1070424 RepID=A0A919QHA3_9ACTN|nr:class F sortase [Acrocarpospora phusangensis]GIH28781.1 class F sortase [Acrocarpospora phusangensis]